MSLFDKILKPLASIFGASSKKKARQGSRSSLRTIKVVQKKAKAVRKKPVKDAPSSRRSVFQKTGNVSRRSSSAGKSGSTSPRTRVSKSAKSVSRTSRAVVSARVKSSFPKTGDAILPKARSGGSSSLKVKSSAGPVTKAASFKVVKNIPSASKEVLIGEITHYFSRIQVAILKMTAGTLKLKESFRVRGTQTDFHQTVTSMQIESADVKIAKKGQLVGIKVEREVRAGDKVYKSG